MELTFAGRVIEWRGPAPYYYGGYLLPLKDAVRRLQQITVGDEITVEMAVRYGPSAP
jgi:hypothetical protein